MAEKRRLPAPRRVSCEKVLTYHGGERRNDKTVKKCFRAWREAQVPPIPNDRCDNPDCRFHTEKLVWNGKALPLELSHRNGVSTDNQPKNLEFLCPNCHAQEVKTRGGANIKMVEKTPGGFAIRRTRGGLRDYHLIADGGKVSGSGASVSLKKQKA
jgi:Zn finger protein HypA/HybF involved in hydrogenase expression